MVMNLYESQSLIPSLPYLHPYTLYVFNSFLDSSLIHPLLVGNGRSKYFLKVCYGYLLCGFFKPHLLCESHLPDPDRPTKEISDIF